MRLRAFGTYTIRVTDPAKFLSEIVGTDGEFTSDEISFQIRSIILSRASAALAASEIPVLDMAANMLDLGKLIAAQVSPQLAEYGLSLPEFYIENISLPPAVEQALDKRTSMGLAGDLGKFTQYSAAEAMTSAAQTTNSGMGAGLGMGMGMAMANAATQAGPWGAAPVAPPPPPVEHVWHIAENGKTTGPFSKADLGRMAADGSLKRESYIWTPGQDGWLKAEDVTEMAQLFTIMPPPPPPAG